MGVSIGFTSPAPNTQVPTTFTTTGFWSIDNSNPPIPGGTFAITSFLVKFGAGAPFVSVPLNDDGTWSATGTLPSGVHHGDAVTVTISAGIRFFSDEHPNDGFSDVIARTLTLVVEIPDQISPVVTVDAFDDDETVSNPPFRVPVLSGRAFDSSGVTLVQYQIDNGPRLTVDTMTGDPTQVVWSVANLDFGVGRHTVTVFATDSRGNVGSATVFVSVRVNLPPAPPELAFATTTYLSELLGLATRTLRLGGGAVGPVVADVAARLNQPLPAIIAPANHAWAVRDVSQPRLAVEVLRAQFSTPQSAAIEQDYRNAAYQELLRTIGTDFQELRLARGADEATRAALAGRIGILVAGAGTQHLNDLLLDPDTLTEADLDVLFGLRPTTPADLAAPHPTAAVLLWRRDAQRDQWFAADRAERDRPAGALPVIDPDLVDETDFTVRDQTNPAYALWVARGQFVAARHAELTAAVAGPHRTLAGFDAAVTAGTRTADGQSLDLTGLSEQDATGLDIRVDLARFGVTLEALRYLARLRALLTTATLTDGEWLDVVAILVQSVKKRLARQWRLDELGAHVVLAPGQFAVDTDLNAPDPDDPLRWRRPNAVRLDWLRTIRVRAQEAEALDTAWQNGVDTAEQTTVPRLRDALIAELGQRHTPAENPRQAAERLSRHLCLDLQAAATTRTSRVTQAIDSVQALLVGARSGAFTGTSGDTLAADSETGFDLEFAWLSAYPRWKSAMTAFAYPENQLRPNVFVPETVTNDIRLVPTGAYLQLLSVLARRPQVTPEDVRRPGGLAAQYLTQLVTEVGALPVGITLTDRRSNAGLLTHRAAAAQILSTAGPGGTPVTSEGAVPQHYRELFLLVPLALARKLQDSGHYQAALDWYRTVFAFHLPTAQRLIYPGLQFESTITPDFGRLPDWLAQTAELNPHLTARKRPSTYTKFTILSIVECFLAFGDAEFSRGTPDSNARAQTLYQTAADLLDLPELAPETSDGPFPVNPVWQGLRTQASNGLAKIHAGLNLAGQTDLAVTASFLPSQYRYSVLVERAKSLVATAQQLEASYLSALTQADSAAYSEEQARRDLAAASAVLTVEDLKVSATDVGITMAQLQRDRATFHTDHFDSLLAAGPNAHERSQLLSLKVARDLQLGASVFKAVGAFTGKSDFLIGGIGDAMSALSGAASLDSQIEGVQASFERRNEDWLFQRANASRDVQLGEQQITAARNQKTIAEADRDAAQLRQEHATATVEFLTTRFTNSALFEWMAGVLGGVYAYFLQQATAMAQLAQAQLAFERQEPNEDLIQRDYWQGPPDPTTLASSPDRRGFTAAERLLQDIARLDQFAFDTDQRKLQLTQTLSLSRFAATELQQLRETGVLTFATPQALFDADFPGHYLRLAKRVSLSVLALVPPVRGVRATLSASGVSRTVVARERFETVTLRRDPESIAFTSAINANGLFELAPDDGKLLPFEGMGVDTVWRLELPKPANPFDLRTIADVLLTVEYTALDSADYRRTVTRALAGEVSSDRSISVRDEFPDAWYAINNPATVNDPAARMRIDLTLTDNDMPRHLTDLAITQLTLFAVRADTLTAELPIAAVRRRAGGVSTDAGPVRTVDGIVGTRRPGGAPWQVFLGGSPVGAWEFQLENTAQVRSWFADGLIDDIVVVFTVAGLAPDWP